MYKINWWVRGNRFGKPMNPLHSHHTNLTKPIAGFQILLRKDRRLQMIVRNNSNDHKTVLINCMSYGPCCNYEIEKTKPANQKQEVNITTPKIVQFYLWYPSPIWNIKSLFNIRTMLLRTDFSKFYHTKIKPESIGPPVLCATLYKVVILKGRDRTESQTYLFFLPLENWFFGFCIRQKWLTG